MLVYIGLLTLGLGGRWEAFDVILAWEFIAAVV